VQRLDIGTQAENVTWAGVGQNGAPLPSGFYTFETVSFDGSSALQQDQTAVYARVTEVQSNEGVSILTLAGGQTIEASTVTALREVGL